MEWYSHSAWRREDESGYSTPWVSARELLDFHDSHCKMVTITGAHPTRRFGLADGSQFEKEPIGILTNRELMAYQPGEWYPLDPLRGKRQFQQLEESDEAQWGIWV